MPSAKVEVLIDNQKLLNNLAESFDQAASRFLNDYKRTLLTRVRDATPVGEKLKRRKDRKHRKGKKAKYFPGTLLKSWQINQEGPAQLTISTNVHYAHVLEYGKYKGVGPRTQAGPGGIFSSRAVGGILRPLLEDRQMIDEAVDRLKKEILRA